MDLFLELFGYLAVVLRGLGLIGQTLSVGSLAFVLAIARPLRAYDTEIAQVVEERTILILRIAAAGTALFALARLGLQLTALVTAADVPLATALGADFVIAWVLQAGCAAAIAIVAGLSRTAGGAAVLAVAAAGVVAGSVLTSHATGRLDGRGPLIVATALHQIGAGVWIGGLPALLVALGRCEDRRTLAFVGQRYSTLAKVAVAALLVGAVILVAAYIGSWPALYGTAYGYMTSLKAVLLALLLALGGANLLLVRRLGRDAAAPVWRFRRFVEVEFGLAVAVLLAAASLTSVPPGVDLPVGDRATFSEIVDRNWPIRPTWSSPKAEELVHQRLEAELERGSGDASDDPRAQGLVPGSGVLLTDQEADKLWSAFNHNWAGVFVLAAGLLAVARRCGLRAGRNWPLVFLGLAVFIFIRSDPNAWPLGPAGFWDSFRSPEALQHRAALPVVVAIGLFEWCVQTGRFRSRTWDYVFPLMAVAGGLLLLTHSHAIENFKELLLVEMSHGVLAILALVIGWSRWLELRSEEGAVKRLAGWVWPVAIVLVGATLIAYREI